MQIEPRIRLIMQPTHSGLVSAKNIGYSNAKGELIAMMDDDDIMLKDRLQLQV